MVFFDADKLHIGVDLSSPHTPIGGTIAGVATITCTQPATVRGIVLSYKVRRDHVPRLDPRLSEHFMRAHGPSAEYVAPMKDNYPKKLHDASYLLLGSRKGAPVDIAPGTYRYPFAIPVPVSLPPSHFGGVVGEAAECESCCPRSFGRSCQCLAIMHYVKVKALIARSPVDKGVQLRVRVTAPLHPLLHHAPRPRAATAVGASQHCIACVPCLPRHCCCALGVEDHRFTVNVERTMLVLGVDRSIPCTVVGHIPFPFRVCLVRESLIKRVYGYHVVASASMPALIQASDALVSADVEMTAGAAAGVRRCGIPLEMGLDAGDAVEICDIPTLRCGDDVVRYFVTVQLDYGGAGCYPGIAEERRVAVPVQLFQCLDEVASVVPDGDDELLAPPPLETMGGGGLDASTANEPSGAYQSPGRNIMYGYVPPEGQAFSPAAAVGEELPDAVWGAVVVGTVVAPSDVRLDASTYPIVAVGTLEGDFMSSHVKVGAGGGGSEANPAAATASPTGGKRAAGGDGDDGAAVSFVDVTKN
jgi:hypothetical protein